MFQLQKYSATATCIWKSLEFHNCRSVVGSTLTFACRLHGDRGHAAHSHGEQRDDRVDKFYNPQVQAYLKQLTGRHFKKIFSKRKVEQKLREAKFSFMTESQLQESIKASETKAEVLLQMPPVLRPMKDVEQVLSFDPYIQGYDYPANSTLVMTDISLNVNDRDRLVIARDPDGTLRHANWDERIKLNKAYFPVPGREFSTPKMFTDIELLTKILERASESDNTYEFVLDRACLQFEPDDPLYLSVVEQTYCAIDKKGDYDYLGSTRHFGPFVFYLIRTRKMDNLLMHYIKTERITPEASILISLFHLVFVESTSGQKLVSADPTGDHTDIDTVRSYIDYDSMKKSELELALNSYLEMRKNKQDMDDSLQESHGG